MRTLILLSFLGCLLAPRAASADEVGVVVTGESLMQPVLASQLEAWLRKHDHKLAPTPLKPDAINQIIDCFVLDDEGCARKIVEKRSTSKVLVYARVDLQPGNDEHTVTVFAYWFEKGHPAVAERRYCERCSDQLLRTTADELMAALSSAGQKDHGHLKLTSSPVGARVLVDGVAIGVSPLEYDLAPGAHKIEIDHAGREHELREVAIKRGETTTLDVMLGAPAEHHGARGASKAGPIAVMGVGGALLLTGVIMIAIDQDPGPDQPFEIRNTGPAGIGIGAAGIAVGVGGYLWYRFTRHESAPVAQITRGGAYVGWLARF